MRIIASAANAARLLWRGLGLALYLVLLECIDASPVLRQEEATNPPLEDTDADATPGPDPEASPEPDGSALGSSIWSVPGLGVAVPVIVYILWWTCVRFVGCLYIHRQNRSTATPAQDAGNAPVPGPVGLGTRVRMGRSRSDVMLRRSNSSSDEDLQLDSFITEDNSPCPICLDPLSEKPVMTGACVHHVHAECMETWLSTQGSHTCPVCRTPLMRHEEDSTAARASSG